MKNQLPKKSSGDTGSMNASTLEKEFNWFAQVLQARFGLYFGQDGQSDIYEIQPPSLDGDLSPYAQTVTALSLDPAERLVLLLALAPHIRPKLLDTFLTKNPVIDRPFTEFGGRFLAHHNSFIPTGETALFLLSGDDMEQRFSNARIFDREHVFYKKKMIRLTDMIRNEPKWGGRLVIGKKFSDKFTS